MRIFYWIKRFFALLFRAFRKKTVDTGIQDKWQELLAILPTVETPLLTYANAIEYFVVERPDDERIHAGAILRRPRSNGHTGLLILQCFLDADHEPIVEKTQPAYGRFVVTQKLDNEFYQVFGQNDLIIAQ